MEYEIAQKLCFWFRNDAFHPNLYIFNQKFDFFLQNPYSSEINPDFFTLSNIGKSPICSTLTFNIFLMTSKSDEKWFLDFVSVNNAGWYSRNVANMG